MENCSQYWTAYVYATSDVFHRAWDEFTATNDDADWHYDQQYDTEWPITRTQFMTMGRRPQRREIESLFRFRNAIERINQLEEDVLALKKKNVGEREEQKENGISTFHYR